MTFCCLQFVGLMYKIQEHPGNFFSPSIQFRLITKASEYQILDGRIPMISPPWFFRRSKIRPIVGVELNHLPTAPTRQVVQSKPPGKGLLAIFTCLWKKLPWKEVERCSTLQPPPMSNSTPMDSSPEGSGQYWCAFLRFFSASFVIITITDT